MASPLTDEPGFVLHSHAYRETSLIVDLFLRERGRVSAVAKGARRPTSALRPVLLQFQPIEFRLSGRNELRTLTRAEWQGGMAVPAGRALLFAFYLNELVMRLLAREDPHPQLFDAYADALYQLGEQGADERILRRFEWLLLTEIGYAPDLACDHRGRHACYRPHRLDAVRRASRHGAVDRREQSAPRGSTAGSAPESRRNRRPVPPDHCDEGDRPPL